MCNKLRDASLQLSTVVMLAAKIMRAPPNMHSTAKRLANAVTRCQAPPSRGLPRASVINSGLGDAGAAAARAGHAFRRHGAGAVALAGAGL